MQSMNKPQDFSIDSFLNASAGESLRRTLDTIALVQQKLLKLSEGGEDEKWRLLKIGTVFQLFLIDALASGKKLKEMTEKDWRGIADQVSKYAVQADDRTYCVFIFTLYADYIDFSAENLRSFAKTDEPSEQSARLEMIRALSAEIRDAEKRLQREEIREADYIETCLWLSLEAMLKLLCFWTTSKLSALIGEEYAKLVQAVSDLAFEYGRYVLYAKEQAILEAYIRNQHQLDEELRVRFENYRAELDDTAARFQGLIDAAFSPDIQDALMQSAALARAAGVREEDLLTTVQDIDSFFLE